MFAGCIENKNTGDGIGSKLLDQMHDGGLAQFPSKSKSYWNGDFGDNSYITVVEQSIHENERLSVDVDSDVLVAGWLRVDNKETLLSELKLSKKTTDRQLIIAAYHLWGDQVCEHIYGDFSFVIINLKEQYCLLCRDHMGVRPLYYYQDETVIVFSTCMTAFLELSPLRIHFSEEYITRYCTSIASDWTLTIYEQILKLPPAHTGKIAFKTESTNESQNKTILPILVQSYFQFDADKRLNLTSEQDYINSYKAFLEEAVRCRVADIDGVLASESSGGIDSSTITAISAQYISEPEENLHAYGFATEVQEEECILMMSQFLNLKNTTLIKDNERDVQLIQQATNEFNGYAATPITAQIATVHSPIYHRAREVGASILLSGFGGDEFVTIYGATARVELYKKRQWSKWFNLFDGGWVIKRLKAVKWLLRFYMNRNTFETAQSLLAMKDDFLKNKVIKKKAFDQYSIEKIVSRRSLYDAGCQSVNEFSLKNRWSPDMVARLEDCSLAAASQGLEYRWPLLDVRLISFFLSVPSEYKLNRGIPRYLHRKAVQGIMPEHLIWKNKSMGGTLVSRDQQLQFPGMDEFLNRNAIPFEDLHDALHGIIDEAEWASTVDQLKNVLTKNYDADAVQKTLSVLQPVISLNEWLSSFKRE